MSSRLFTNWQQRSTDKTEYVASGESNDVKEIIEKSILIFDNMDANQKTR